jgi:hypothetical protein
VVAGGWHVSTCVFGIEYLNLPEAILKIHTRLLTTALSLISPGMFQKAP